MCITCMCMCVYIYIWFHNLTWVDFRATSKKHRNPQLDLTVKKCPPQRRESITFTAHVLFACPFQMTKQIFLNPLGRNTSQPLWHRWKMAVKSDARFETSISFAAFCHPLCGSFSGTNDAYVIQCILKMCICE